MTDARQTVLITGCAPGGIGHSLAINLHDAGLRVFATARSTDALATLADRGIETFPLDVTSLKDIRRIREVIDGLTGGKLDILINNA